MDEKETNNSKAKMLWKSLPLKIKLIIIGIAIGFFFLIIFLVVLITPLMSLGIIEIAEGTTGSGSSNYSYISSSTNYWWPIGSNETTSIGGALFAGGDPVDTVITSYFGGRIHPITGEKSNHTGTDIASYGGANLNIIAVQSGTVIYPTKNDKVNCSSSGNDLSCGGGYGNYVMIQHADGNISLYAHLYENSITVSAGDQVGQGQVIGKMGSSGRSTGTHLHFEIRKNGQRVDGLNYVSEENPRPKDNKGYVGGNDNQQAVCLSLKNAGYSNNSIAGIMGNLKGENSAFNPSLVNEIDCVGIAQWCFGRKDNLKSTYGNDWNKINSQVEYLLYELNDRYPTIRNYLMENHTIDDTTYYFCMNFERPGEGPCKAGNRQKFANELITYINNGCN